MHALVTGGAGGLGPAIVRALAAAGYDLTIHHRRSAGRATALAAEVAARGRRVEVLAADLASPAAAAGLVSEAHARHGTLEALVHVVGPFNFVKRPVADHSPAQWERLLTANLAACFYLLRAAVPIMRAQGHGRIIAFGCAEADRAAPWPGHGVYAAAKSALVTLMRTVAAEEAGHGITANLVLPGIIDRAHKEADRTDVAGRPDRWDPARRPGTGGDIARVVTFLCSANADYINGAAIAVDGGLDVRSLTSLPAHRGETPGPQCHK